MDRIVIKMIGIPYQCEERPPYKDGGSGILRS